MQTLRKTDEDVVILPGAMVSGDVRIGAGSSIWYNAVVRGDTEPIAIGEGSNIQDNCVLHTSAGAPLTIGRGVSVGHAAVVHGCTIGDDTLIGMGTIVLNGAVIGRGCIVGAGSLVTGGTRIPDGSLAFGRPARVVRPLRAEEIEENRATAAGYEKKRELYR